MTAHHTSALDALALIDLADFAAWCAERRDEAVDDLAVLARLGPARARQALQLRVGELGEGFRL